MEPRFFRNWRPLQYMLRLSSCKALNETQPRHFNDCLTEDWLVPVDPAKCFEVFSQNQEEHTTLECNVFDYIL